MQALRFLAFYLPQFHPIPENDRFWGAGFTEWTNVRKARPLFDGHYQPHVPADLGYYDLREPGVREQQAALARQYGVDGFVYYHYWFNGRRLLERPFDEVRASGRPDLPFCLCWANENWTRAWDGGDGQTLVRQQYSGEDDLNHIRWLAGAFADPRYIRVGGKPLFLVYRAGRLPDPPRTIETWRSEAARLGIGELYLCRVENFPDERTDPGALGFDAGVEFQLDWLGLGLATTHPRIPTLPAPAPQPSTVHTFEYSNAVALALTRPDPGYRRYRCVSPGFDSTPRRQLTPTIIQRATPDLYAHFLHGVINQFVPFSADENLVFINAWNEWAEGNHLEPDQRWGRGFLEAHRAVVEHCRQAKDEPSSSSTG